ncbi:MAG: LamG domain-containing protein [Planctomycetales bacterium]|nr:LamG domain-containing protein [Planctomycetales bacterium]
MTGLPSRCCFAACAFLIMLSTIEAGTGGVSPTAIPGNILWLDANDVDGDGSPDSTPNGSLVTTWVDKSPGGFDVTLPATDGGNPLQFQNALNGNSIVRFSDALAKLDNATFNVANDYTLFTVVTHPTAGGGRHVLSGMFEEGTDAVLYTNTGWRFYSGPGGTDLQISSAARSGTQIFGYQLDSTGLLGGDLGLFGDRDSFSEVGGLDWGGTGTLNGIRIGGINRGVAGDPQTANNEGWLGDIAEVLIYDRPLDPSERQSLASYLQNKWYAEPLPPDGHAPLTPYSSAVLGDSPLHYYRFEETHTDQLAKDSVGSQDGTIRGGITAGQSSVQPNLGNAFYFDGTPGTLVDLGTPFHPASGIISVEAWVNVDVDAPATFLPIAARWDGSYELDVANGGGATAEGRLNLVSRNEGTNVFGIAASSDPLVKGEWHHVVGSFENGLLTVWIDGALVGTADTGEQPTTLQDAGATLFIGSTRDGSAFNWKGFIDDVAFYDYALSEQQIAAHIRAIPEPASGLTLAAGLLVLLFGTRRRRAA